MKHSQELYLILFAIYFESITISYTNTSLYINYTPYLLQTIFNLMVLFIGKILNKEVKSIIK